MTPRRTIAIVFAGLAAMSIGMGIVISAAGYIAYAGRESLFSQIKARESVIGQVSDGLEVFSYLIVLGFSLYMAWPSIAGVVVPR